MGALTLTAVACVFAFICPLTFGNFGGRIPMGVDPDCDPGDDPTGVDWDNSTNLDYKCQAGESFTAIADSTARIMCRQIDYPWHRCMNERIYYKDAPPLSGPHRPSWPRYGEYLYVPPQRYVHSLEHGAAVFLYHPCANPTEIAMLKNLARSCLYRHVITPSRLLQPDRPFAILTWGCMLSMGKLDVWVSRHYIRRYAIMRAPEARVFTDGQYSRGLIQAASVVSDQADSLLCPTTPEKSQFLNAMRVTYSPMRASQNLKSNSKQREGNRTGYKPSSNQPS